MRVRVPLAAERGLAPVEEREGPLAEPPAVLGAHERVGVHAGELEPVACGVRRGLGEVPDPGRGVAGDVDVSAVCELDESLEVREQAGEAVADRLTSYGRRHP